MKNLLFLILVFINVPLMGQNKTSGAYLSTNKDINRLFLISTNYLSIITYKDNTYLGTLGGPITNDKNAIHLSIEYHDQYPDSVGLKKTIPIQLNNNRNLKIDGLQVIKTKHKQQDLDGLWRITSRQAGDKMNAIPKRGSIPKVVCGMKMNCDFCRKVFHFEPVSRINKVDLTRVLSRTF